MPSHSFISGVVEGFYGRTWTREQRHALFQGLSNWGLNTYCYGPKDDLKHRALWRSCYDKSETTELKDLVDRCSDLDLNFIYSLGPGLDIQYGKPDDLDIIKCRFGQLVDLGVRNFALLFDDIPDVMHPDDQSQFSSFAEGQSFVANEIYQWLGTDNPDIGFLFCPTPYCGRMDQAGLGGPGYLEEIGERLHPAIRIFWTGPEIISQTISEEHLSELSVRLKRPAILWDNLHANDYDMQRVFTGPYCGRPAEPGKYLSGILINPNCEFEANFVPIRTLSFYLGESELMGGHAARWGQHALPSPDIEESELRAEDEARDPRAHYMKAVREWFGLFLGVGDEWTLDDVVFLADLFYLPFELGESACEFLEDASILVHQSCDDWGDRENRFRKRVKQIEAISVKLTELKNRDLFYAFNRQWWDLREETELLLKYLDWKKNPESGDIFSSSEHHAGTFRGGTLNLLQNLLKMTDQGTFETGDE